MKTSERLQYEEEAKRLAEITGGDPDEFLELARLGFEELDATPHFRMILSTSAKEKMGKTHFSLATAPDPIALVNLDLGTEGVVEKFPGRRILETKITTRQERLLNGDNYTQDDAEADWTRLVSILRGIVKCKTIRTLVCDTGTEAWEICRLADHGKLKEVMPHEYAATNAKFRGAVSLPYQRNDLNAIYTHKVKKEYKGKNWSGQYERQGFNDMPFVVQTNLEHFRVDEDEDEAQPFGIRIIDSRQNPDAAGEELIGPACTFAMLGRLIHPNSKKSDWV